MFCRICSGVSSRELVNGGKPTSVVCMRMPRLQMSHALSYLQANITDGRRVSGNKL